MRSVGEFVLRERVPAANGAGAIRETIVRCERCKHFEQSPRRDDNGMGVCAQSTPLMPTTAAPQVVLRVAVSRYHGCVLFEAKQAT